MSPQKIPEKTFEIFELKFPLALFGPESSWVEKAHKIIQKTNSESILLTTHPTVIAPEPSISSKEIAREQLHLPNLCVITKPIEMYLELVAINFLEKKMQIVVYDGHKVAKGWITLNF